MKNADKRMQLYVYIYCLEVHIYNFHQNVNTVKNAMCNKMYKNLPTYFQFKLLKIKVKDVENKKSNN